MPYTVTKYPVGTFSWADVATVDIAATTKFMNGLLGWTAQAMPTGKGTDYTMFFLGDKVTAGAMPTPKDMPGVGTWNSYVTVKSADETAAKAEKLGGKVVMPTMDVLDQGRMVGIQDPQGAVVFAWQPLKFAGAQIVNIAGAPSWNELYVRDLAAAQKFYGDLFGWTFESAEGMKDYMMIKNNGRMNGGIMKITPEMGPMPPKWMVYFTVTNMDESLKKVNDMGGKVWTTKDIGAGKMSVVADPTGASFMLMEMSDKMPPTEWVE